MERYEALPPISGEAVTTGADDWVLSADVGGTAIGVGVVSPEGEVRLAREVPTLGRGPGTALQTILEVVGETGEQARALGIGLAGCGIGVPGAVDVRTGRIGPDVQNLPELAGCPLAEWIRGPTGLPTVVDNDVNALALGEARFGAARGLRSFVLLALGTGVGGGLYLDGDLVRGASGYGGEVGHMTVRFDGRPCFCGSRGCLKAYVAGPDIAAQAREGLSDHPGSSLHQVGPETLSAPAVFRAAAAGDVLAVGVVARVCHALGAAIGSLMNGFNPEAVLLAGGVAQALGAHLDRVVHHARAYALAGAAAAARVVIVPTTKTTTVRGPAALFLHEAVRRSPAA